MALDTPVVAINYEIQDVGGTSTVTDSYAFQNNKTYLAAVATRDDDVSSLTGGGITWTEVVEDFQTVSDSLGLRLAVFRGRTASGASTGGLTVTTATTVKDVHVLVLELPNADNSGTVGNGVEQAVANSSATNTVTATLAAFADAGNATIGFAAAVRTSTSITIAAGAGFTSLAQTTHTAFAHSTRLMAQWRSDNDTTVDATASQGDDRAIISIGLEIIPAAATVNLAAILAANFAGSND